MIRKALVVVFVSFFVLYSCDFNDDTDQQEREDSVKKDVKLVVFGDSIAVGLFSDSQIGESASIDHPLAKVLLNSVADKDKSSSEISEYYRKNVENSFTCPTSDCKFSLAHQLQIPGKQSDSYAFVGSRYSTPADGKAVTISQQIAKFAKRAGSAEIYVLEGGANDFCATDYDKSKVEQAIKQAIDEVYAQNAEAKVIVVPVPDILRVFKVARDSDIAIGKIDGKDASTIQPQQCQKIRGNACARISGDSTTETELEAELTALNAAITGIVKTIKEGGKKIAVADGVASFQFGKEHIAADCFHPSAEGLKEIAKHTKQAYDTLK